MYDHRPETGAFNAGTAQDRMKNNMRISVIVPTYRRVTDLGRCIDSLEDQTRRADEVLLMVRVGDPETLSYLKKRSLPHGFKVERIEESGQVAAMNQGIDRSSGEVIVFLDDDAAPASDWLERIGSHYESEPCLGGLGGRDRVHLGNDVLEAMVCRVGVITWYGRIIGNHHLGTGAPREVDHLKGANMSFRRRALGGIRCDSGLAGKGAQYRNDMALSLAVRRKGWLIVYDPGVLVDHFYSVRFDEDQRGVYDPVATSDLAHNEILVILRYLSGPRRFMAFLWSFMVSSTAIPGFLQVLRMATKGHPDAFSRFRDGMSGRCRGVRTYVLSR